MYARLRFYGNITHRFARLSSARCDKPQRKERGCLKLLEDGAFVEQSQRRSGA